jgi:hypothetical protein
MATKGMASEISLVRFAVWILASVVFLDQRWNKIARLRSAGQYVSPWQYAQTVFWVVVLLFWIWSGWKSWKRYHADKG